MIMLTYANSSIIIKFNNLIIQINVEMILMIEIVDDFRNRRHRRIAPGSTKNSTVLRNCAGSKSTVNPRLPVRGQNNRKRKRSRKERVARAADPTDRADPTTGVKVRVRRTCSGCFKRRC